MGMPLAVNDIVRRRPRGRMPNRTAAPASPLSPCPASAHVPGAAARQQRNMFGGDDDYRESESDSDSPDVALWKSDPPPRAAPATPRPVRPADPGSASLAHVSGPVMLQIFLLLQTDDRMRCREVCPG